MLQKEHRNVARLTPWLEKRAVKVMRTKGAGGVEVLRYETPTLKGFASAKLAPLEKALQSSASCMEIGEGEMPSLAVVAKRAAAAALATLEMQEGNNLNVRQAPVMYDSTDTERLWFSLHSKHSGMSSIVTDSEYCFGGYIRTLECQFCLSCNNITKCSGCFECDSCYSCRNCLFCHNCENV
ncbi:MAG: hypothetical protein WC263_02890, partial [Candidatus Micrarchaeia archaeon]